MYNRNEPDIKFNEFSLIKGYIETKYVYLIKKSFCCKLVL